jgi:hypothetical protein
MIQVNEYDYIDIEDYNGKKSLVLGYEKKDGSFGVKWCKMEFGKGNEKNVPVKIPLGNAEQAIDILQTLIIELQGDEKAPF